jgi:hypothetical protein
MIDTKNSGYLVETKDGKTGRTFHKKGLINGKLPVYLCIKFGTHADYPEFQIPLVFSETAILCDPNTVKRTGFID